MSKRPWWAWSPAEVILDALWVILICHFWIGWPSGLAQWLLLPVGLFGGKAAWSLVAELVSELVAGRKR